MYSIHHDEANYSCASRFDAFRFSRPREEHEAKSQAANDNNANRTVQPSNETEAIPALKQKPQSTVNLGDGFLTFGYGRHACPGRFFASHEMKLMLAHIIQHYDVEYLAERPPQQAVMEVKMPSDSATNGVRRSMKG